MVSKSPKAAPSPLKQQPVEVGAVDHYFGITRRRSTVGHEIRGGLVTFFTMAYILALNPIIVGTAKDKDGRLVSGLLASDPGAIPTTMAMVAAATALIAGLMTILMGVVGRYPLALATGLGLNAMLAYVIAPTMTWPQALSLIVWEGILITILVLTGFRTAVFRAVPPVLRTAISVGIGLFIAFVGVVDGGLVRRMPDSGGSTVPVQFGVDGSLLGWPILVFCIGLILVALLYARKVRGALLIAIVATTVVAIVVEAVAHPGSVMQHKTGWMLNIPTIPDISRVFVAPNFGTIGRVDMFGAFFSDGHFNTVAAVGLLLTIFSLLLSDFFDTMGTIVAIGAEGNLLDDEGNPPLVGRILLVDSIAAIAGGAGGVSSNTSYIESAAGVGEGARTGLASVVTGAAFLLSIFASPLVNVIPSEAAAPVLVFVGFLMMGGVAQINWTAVEEGLPAFLTIIFMPFTYSITTGIGAGFIFYAALKTVRGKAKEIHPLLWVVAVGFLLFFLQGVIMGWAR